ncbi:MAG: single-stranded-DNA-specific exonuclease RecJ [Lachnospiraceae bacterium]|nr:single-stranded-DNA-specific exonuclease RecJ [Lachnospiraceae bacterium]
MANWMVAAKKADFEAWANEFHISPVTARLVRNRGVVSMEEAAKFLHDDAGHDAYGLKDVVTAASELLKCREEQGRVRIIGDYDVDGICSSYILKAGLTFAGFLVDVVLPERIRDGYGLNTNLVADAFADDIALILTCDNGIAAHDAVLSAREKGMKILVTDHHEVQKDEAGNDILPQADAVVNPKRSDCSYPFEGICGAVVAYKLLEVLFAEDVKEGNAPYGAEASKRCLKSLQPFTALATVCDVMELVDENRGIVRRGLLEMATTTNHGLKALINVTGLDAAGISAYHLGFVLGPCLNASGRLDTAKRALSLFEATSEAHAVQIATDLKELNDSRKEMTAKATEEATALAQNLLKEQPALKILVLYLPDCHESIAGIVAGRIREKFFRPVIVLTDALGEEGEVKMVKGSGRSIESYHMFEGLSKCADLFVKFGGHKMAAGMTLAQKDVAALTNRLNASCNLTEDDFTETLHIDMELPLSYMTLPLVEEFSCLEPFGNGNPKPLFVTRDLTLEKGVRIGRDASMGRFSVRDDQGKMHTLMRFSDVEELFSMLEEKPPVTINAVYEANRNVYRGETSVQFILRDYKRKP